MLQEKKTSSAKKVFTFWILIVFGLALLPQFATGQAQDLSTVAVNKISQIEPIVENLAKNNSAPVIVRLSVNTNIDAELSGIKQVNQREQIANAQQHLISQLNGVSYSNLKTFTTDAIISLHVNSESLNKLAELPLVEKIYPDRLLKPILSESTVQIGADVVWDFGYTGDNQAIVILDTGVDTGNSFFEDRVIAEACFSTTSSENNSTSVCPGGASSSTTEGSGINCDPEEDGPGCWHGSHVAGIAAGGSASAPISGVAPDANIISIQVFSSFNDATLCDGDPPCVLSYFSDQISGLEHVYTDLSGMIDIASVNMSIGNTEEVTSPCENSYIKTQIDNLKLAGIATIIASGNEGHTNGLSNPACIPNAVSVGAVNDNDEVASFSNSASFLDLLAPGVDITSAYISDISDFATSSGTSMAAPHVAGVWALMKQAHPDASVDSILTILKESGVTITDSRNGLDFPRIQIDEALTTDFVAHIGEDGSLQNEGWRLISSPVSTTYDELLDPLWTQGSTKSNYQESPSPNVLFYNDDYVPVADLGSTLPVGQGVAVYVYEDDNFDGNADPWPKNLSVSGIELNTNVTVSPILNPGEDVFTLLGNPYYSSIDFDGFTNLNDIGGTVYVYDHAFEADPFVNPDVSGGASGGGFRAWNGTGGSLDGGHIAPFQAFFVYATGDSPTLNIPLSAKTDMETDFYKERNSSPVIQVAAQINDRHSADTWFSFTESGSLEKNDKDAPYLYPLDYKPFLSIRSETNGSGYLIKNLPLSFNEPIQIPITVEAWNTLDNEASQGYMPAGGNVKLIWPEFRNIPDSWTVTLTDHQMGSVIDMKNSERYNFTLSEPKGKLRSLPYSMKINTASKESITKARFTLTVYPQSTVSKTARETPSEFALSQNYPNPFNPSTVIRYSLSEKSPVELDVFTIDGQKVATLVNELQSAGNHAVTFRAGNLSSGIYLYRLSTSNNLFTRKMILIK